MSDRLPAVAFAVCVAMIAVGLSARIGVTLLVSSLDDWRTYRRLRRLKGRK